MNSGHLAVHQCARMHDASAERLTYGLVAKADTKNWDLARESRHNLQRHPCLVGCARPGRDHDPVWLQTLDCVDVEFVVAHHTNIFPKLTEVLHDVVGE